jgi:cytochrome c oxidase subunit 3
MSETREADVTEMIAFPTRPSPPDAIASPGAARWGMIAFLASEVAFFSTLIVAYVTFLGRDNVGPTPREALSLPLVLATTACLLSSSGTIHLADRDARRGRRGGFLLWWAATIVLGVVFLLGTAYEWSELISRHHLTIDRNLFGTTYYTLVGFHGLHVTAGVVVMSIVLGLALGRRASETGIELVSWYWHFVDAVWVAVFTVVYLIGR